MKDIYEKMLEIDPGFKAFVEAQKDKSTEEIAKEYGIKLVNKGIISNISRTNLGQILDKF